jgi:hypothetical protein
MKIKSATLSVSGHPFKPNLSSVLGRTRHGSDEDTPQQSVDELCNSLGALLIPPHSKPVEDINFWPWPRDINSTAAWLTLDLGIPIMTEHEETPGDLDFWPDFAR